MKNLELENLGVQEMNADEMQNVDGGFLPLVIIGVALLLGSCRATKPAVYPDHTK